MTRLQVPSAPWRWRGSPHTAFWSVSRRSSWFQGLTQIDFVSLRQIRHSLEEELHSQGICEEGPSGGGVSACWNWAGWQINSASWLGWRWCWGAAVYNPWKGKNICKALPVVWAGQLWKQPSAWGSDLVNSSAIGNGLEAQYSEKYFSIPLCTLGAVNLFMLP